MNKKVILVIMDGWGLGKIASSDAIQQANVPFVSSLYQQYPNTTLITCGEEVGLPEGQMGNSEVGHLNLGAGRIVYQELQRINVAVKTGELANNGNFLATLSYAKTHQKALHLIGLVSDGGVHSHIDHLKAICDLCQKNQLSQVFIHVFTDGRDTDPKSGLSFVKELEAHLQYSVGTIATVSGRYYAMDRDKRWERVKLAYDCLVNAVGPTATSAVSAIENAYKNGTTDEFILPTIITNEHQQPIASIKEGDAVICFNFRTDRCREITEVLTQQAFPEHGMQPLQLHYTTMTQYDQKFKKVNVIFENDNLTNTLGEVLEAHGKKQIRIAETEKYPHVTFFFSGGREVPFEGEKRIMVPSPKVATYDLQPEMSAVEITDQLIPEIEAGVVDFVCLNYANTDMVGHTGVFSAAIKAAETVDTCVKRVVTAGLASGYTIFLTADHGNADFMINEDGSPNTAHTLNPVPFFIIDKEWKGVIKPGKLGDIAPTILTMMNLSIPAEMTGNVLI
ncbi:MAG: 2,3-bisphosphoglycerate-independent phosphoglycerate mutase [Sediminibacterium sp. Gen4]|jgi:2,3-bisphosphoglycerate-independent phosphoglycerate mutase|uniref:2,3-bisphosphoglycerate-independent phosphoglycerate mutase n=1 Tax=unclassified Sediminibacterium TaxID=2635961 RepID=UPI0015BE4515|nr:MULTISPECIES: 2,3-bisphosphoglycerate-independent phosphoglycerate mutase [unclassified Sediminibacterium]MBW0162130.1 2,3-bisphosphoglycerate-independent phosphoglycerate mutase [Sediminibacterium sp.]MBW0163596.1 2,3-bisphosphoglycerate-independent phosphoglycerate mutase [Sediminibacterium sp.]NWK66479.1 2,3-bisphosphoglycerate-independent phosphoglycerate mutase [Sediminibacterium sp. Gen4]